MNMVVEGGQWETEGREIVGGRGTKSLSAVRQNTRGIEMCY